MGTNQVKGLPSRNQQTSHGNNVVAAVIAPPIVPLQEIYQGVEHAWGNFTVESTSFPELTMPIETKILGPRPSDLASLTGVVLLTQVGRTIGTVVGLNRMVNSSVYRVLGIQLIPGTLLDVNPTPNRFTPHLQFVGEVGSTPTPTKKAIHLDLDEYQ
jgi:hypothetical protein